MPKKSLNKTLRNSVLCDNTPGGVGFIDQLFHKASYLKAATLAYVPFCVLHRSREADREPQTQEGGAEKQSAQELQKTYVGRYRAQFPNTNVHKL